MQEMSELTPRRIVDLLDQHIVGQNNAKKVVAVALRNRWRRQQLSLADADEVYPKNILLVGPTGVGKTEIARRLAALAAAPFLKVEATRFSEVGYHGRDVESMIRDLIESALGMVRREHAVVVEKQAKQATEERLFSALAAHLGLTLQDTDSPAAMPIFVGDNNEFIVPPTIDFVDTDEDDDDDYDDDDFDDELETEGEYDPDRLAALRQEMLAGKHDREVLEIMLEDTSRPTLDIQSGQGNESMAIDASALGEMWGRNVGPRYKTRKLSLREAQHYIFEEETNKLIDADAMLQEALHRTENDGIIFLDEIDKIVGAGATDGPDVSREGVQRDLLPLVEGTSVFTKHGYVRTDHILFIGAGAFSMSKPADLIPEMQGRFPVRVALTSLGEEDFQRILTEPKNALTRQYRLLLAAEKVDLVFTGCGITAIAQVATKANKITQDIGARRLMTVMEKLLDEVSFTAPEKGGTSIEINAEFVRDRLGDAADDDDLIKYRI